MDLQSDLLTDDTDADDSASLEVTSIQPSGGSSSTFQQEVHIIVVEQK